MVKNFFFKTAVLILLLFNGAISNAQVTIGGNNEPQSFSVLELISGDNKGLRLPQIANDTERKALELSFGDKATTDAMGLQIFNMHSRCVETWNGYTWISLCGEPAPEPNYVDVCGNGTKWAKYNVGEFGEFVENETDLGKFYQWNRPTSWDVDVPGSISGWDRNNSAFSDNTWASQNNPCPSGWRVPTSSEIQCLIGVFDTFTTQNGVNGCLFGTAPNQIFLPAVGYRNYISGILRDVGETCRYWSSTEFNSLNAYCFRYDNNANSFQYSKTHGFSVRCVAE